MTSIRSNKTKGATFESQVRDWMQDYLAPTVGGEHPVTIECKNVQRIDLPLFCREARREASHANSPYWVVVVRTRGQTDIGQSLVVTTLDQWSAQTSASRTQVERIRLSGQQDRGDLSGVFI